MARDVLTTLGASTTVSTSTRTMSTSTSTNTSTRNLYSGCTRVQVRVPSTTSLVMAPFDMSFYRRSTVNMALFCVIFWDKARSWPKIMTFSYHPCIRWPIRGSPLDYSAVRFYAVNWNGVATRICFLVSTHARTCQTDERTDRQTDRHLTVA